MTFKNLICRDALEQFDLFVFIAGGNVIFFLLVASIIILLGLFLVKFFFTNNNFSLALNFLLELVKSTVYSNMTNPRFNYTAYLPFFYMIFFFILFSNLIGLVPFTYTLTSLLVLPFFFSSINFFFTTFLAVRSFGLGFFGGFLPAGTNIFIAPLLILIEMISYFVKVLSLAVRLFANLFAGHVLVKVLISLAWMLLAKAAAASAVLAFLLFLLVIAILFLELFICFLQAFVFINLASIYLDQAVNFLKH